MALFEKKQDNKYFNWDEILKLNCMFNVAVGQRGPGKSYASLEQMIKRYFQCKTKDGKHFEGAIIRRNREDFIGKRGSAMFSSLVNNGLVKKYSKGQYDTIVYYSSRWYFANKIQDVDKQGNLIEKVIKADEPFCYGFDLSTYYHDKSTSFPNVRTILFDEFIADPNVQDYLPDECRIFFEVCSTIVREISTEKQFNEYKIFLCGNSLNIYAPYFAFFGIPDVTKIKPGQTMVFDYKDKQGNPVLMKLSFTITDTQITKNNLISHMFAFNSPNLNLLTGDSDGENGLWLLNQSPKCPMEYKPTDVEYTYFILFDRKIYQCEIVVLDDCSFTYIHPKTTPLRHIEEDLIFDPYSDSPMPNFRKYICEPDNKFLKFIWSYYQKHLVYYSDNMTANAIANYVNMR